jgi:hypothetical protein
MKPAGLLPLFSAGLVAIAAAEESASGLVSREIKAHIRESLPTYQPTPPTADGNAADPPPVTAADVLVLPKMIVKEHRLPRDADDHLMSKRDFKRKMENIYLDTLAEAGPLNFLLNSFTIPLLSPSKAARGRAIYRARELERLQHVVNVSKALDPEADKKFRQEMDNTHTTRPAGIK